MTRRRRQELQQHLNFIAATDLGSFPALCTLNLGDSGYMIIRDSQVFYKSVAQSHRYNAPYQIGCTPPELSEINLYRDKNKN